MVYDAIRTRPRCHEFRLLDGWGSGWKSEFPECERRGMVDLPWYTTDGPWLPYPTTGIYIARADKRYEY